MQFTPRCRAAALTLPLAVVLGCGSDGLTGPLNQLSPESAADAFDALLVASQTDLGFGEFRTAAAVRAEPVSLPLASVVFPVDESQPCALGGSTRVRGSMSLDEETFGGSVDFRQSYNDCRAASSSGREWTFNGDPHVRTKMTFEGLTANGSGTMTGGFGFSSEDESGRCTISVTLTFTQVGGRIVGTACGQPIDEDVVIDDTGFSRSVRR